MSKTRQFVFDTNRRAQYCVWMSYIGTRFKGSQYQPNQVTVQGVLEQALATICNVPTAFIRTSNSSRTDTGVHAIASTFWADLPFDQDTTKSFDAVHLMHECNQMFVRHDIAARVIRARRVHHNWCPRYQALARTYVYRIAVLRREAEHQHKASSLPPNRLSQSLLPLLEQDRCWALSPGLDIGRVSSACEMLCGTKDMASFARLPARELYKDNRQAEWMRRTKRRIFDVRIEPTSSLVDCQLDPSVSLFSFYSITFTANSFVREQIRRMMHVLIAVGKHHLDLHDVRELLQYPSPTTYERITKKASTMDPTLARAPPHGLYLKEVHYEDRHFDAPVYGRQIGPGEPEPFWRHRLREHNVKFVGFPLTDAQLIAVLCAAALD